MVSLAAIPKHIVNQPAISGFPHSTPHTIEECSSAWWLDVNEKQRNHSLPASKPAMKALLKLRSNYKIDMFIEWIDLLLATNEQTLKSKLISMYFPKRLLLSFRLVFAFPKASKTQFDCNNMFFTLKQIKNRIELYIDGECMFCMCSSNFQTLTIHRRIRQMPHAPTSITNKNRWLLLIIDDSSSVSIDIWNRVESKWHWCNSRNQH